MDDEHDRRRVRNGIVRQTLLPVRGDQPALAQCINIARQRQRHHVGLLVALDDFGCLPPRTAMRLLDFHRDARLSPVLVDKGFVERGAKLSHRVVGDAENLVWRIVAVQVVHRDQGRRDDDGDDTEDIEPENGKTKSAARR
jgi:hypothetical protein